MNFQKTEVSVKKSNTDIKKRICSIGASVLMLGSMFGFSGTSVTPNFLGVTPVVVSAATKSTAESVLQKAIANGKIEGAKDAAGNDIKIDKSGEKYKLEGGGTIGYKDIVIQSTTNSARVGLVNGNFNKLTAKEKERLLTDMIEVGNAAVEASNQSGGNDFSDVTDQTLSTWMEGLQACDGVGTELMTALLQNTKPDYVKANKIYEPFSGIVGTILGLGAVLLMAFLAITMLTDIAYIGLPPFRMFCDSLGGDGNGGRGGSGGKPKFISHEAITSIEEAEGGQGGHGQSGSAKKVAIAQYFKKRVIMLIVLGICLLYLISGNIFTLVGWILNLLRGFLGF